MPNPERGRKPIYGSFAVGAVRWRQDPRSPIDGWRVDRNTRFGSKPVAIPGFPLRTRRQFPDSIAHGRGARATQYGHIGSSAVAELADAELWCIMPS